MAITTALDVKQGDVRAVRSFSRHADVKTLLYDDSRVNSRGDIAALMAGNVLPDVVRGRRAERRRR